MLPAAVLNPHHAGHERKEGIPRQLRAWSVVVLVGTQQHAESDTAVTVNRYPFHWSLNFGWRRGPLLRDQDTSGAQLAEGDAP